VVEKVNNLLLLSFILSTIILIPGVNIYKSFVPNTIAPRHIRETLQHNQSLVGLVVIGAGLEPLDARTDSQTRLK
jgi:hypothetical protein